MGHRRQRRFDRLRQRVLQGPGKAYGALRHGAFERDVGRLPEALQAYVAKVHDHAYRVTDDDIARLQAAGYSDDEVFELTVAAAVGAGWSRLKAAQRVLGPDPA